MTRRLSITGALEFFFLQVVHACMHARQEENDHQFANHVGFRGRRATATTTTWIYVFIPSRQSAVVINYWENRCTKRNSIIVRHQYCSVVRTRSLWYAPKRRTTGHVSPNDTRLVPNEQSVVHSIANLGLAQKRAGFLCKAKKRITMQASLELH